jgi:hypothetical protein
MALTRLLGHLLICDSIHYGKSVVPQLGGSRSPSSCGAEGEQGSVVAASWPHSPDMGVEVNSAALPYGRDTSRLSASSARPSRSAGDLDVGIGAGSRRYTSQASGALALQKVINQGISAGYLHPSTSLRASWHPALQLRSLVMSSQCFTAAAVWTRPPGAFSAVIDRRYSQKRLLQRLRKMRPRPTALR